MRVGVGAKMNAMDAELAPSGWEIRMHPSTKRTATIGGFVAGGSAASARSITAACASPATFSPPASSRSRTSRVIIELRGDAAQKINRAYGTTGIITALEMPTSPAWKWIDVVVVFDDFIEAAAVGYEAALADGIVKKLLTPMTAPIPSYFGALKPYCPDGKSILIAMIAEPSLEGFKKLLAGRGTITLETPTDDGPGQVPLYEYTWNHTTLQVLKTDRTVTYLQCLYPHDELMEKVAQMRAMFPDEVLQHLEFIRFNGRVTCSGLPVVRYTTAERLERDHPAARGERRLHRQPPRLYRRGRQPLQARRCRPTRLQARGRSLRPAQSRQDAQLRDREAVSMNVLYVYCHPLDDSFHAAIRKEALAGLREAGHTIDLLDLYAEGFDPVLSADRRRDYHDPVRNRANNQTYVDRLMAANALVVQFPTWSFGPPAMLKGLVRPDVRAGNRDGSFRSGASQAGAASHRRITGISTYGRPRWQAIGMADPPRKIIKRYLPWFTGCKATVRYYALYHMNTATPERRGRFLARVRKEMARF